MTTRNTGLLANYRVLDLTGEQGALCARLFADLGADVVKVEPIGGCPSRRTPPFRDGHTDLESSLWFQFYNAGKRSITLNLETETGRELLRGIVRHADVLLEAFPFGYLAERGLSVSELETINDRLVVASIAGFGTGGPYASFNDPEAVLLAMAGVLSLSGNANEEPCPPPHGLAYETASLFAAIGILASLGADDRHAQVSSIAYQCATLLTDSGIPKASSGGDPKREGDAYLTITPGGLYRCKDGYVRIVAGQLRHWRALVDWMGRPDAISDPAWEDRQKRNRNRAVIDAAIGAFTADKTRQFLFKEGQSHRVPLTPVHTPSEFLDSEWASSRRFVQELTDHAFGRIRTLAAPFVVDGERPDPSSKAPTLGQHNWEFYVKDTNALSGTELEYLFAAGAV
jgi:crotonobetainyl-CoA:carnitine CoA-transferase CaiB-like acyl-CoA transferase